MNILLNWIQLISKFWIEFWIEFTIQKLFWIIFWIEFCRNIYIESFVELNLDEANENESYIESIFWIFKWKAPFLVYFGHFSDSTSINDSLTIELNYLLNWITTIIFELNNCLNWILGNQYWIKYWIESNFDEIQTLNWIVLGIDQG